MCDILERVPASFAQFHEQVGWGPALGASQKWSNFQSWWLQGIRFGWLGYTCWVWRRSLFSQDISMHYGSISGIKDLKYLKMQRPSFCNDENQKKFGLFLCKRSCQGWVLLRFLGGISFKTFWVKKKKIHVSFVISPLWLKEHLKRQTCKKLCPTHAI